MINLLWFLNIYALKVVLRSKVLHSQFLTIELLVTSNIMYEQKHPLNAHADISSTTRSKFW